MKNIESKIMWTYNFKDTPAEKKVKELAKELTLSELEVAILWNRGYKSKEEIIQFLDLSKKDILDPRLMKDADKGADLIIKHMNEGNKIVNFSDFDADGWGSTVNFLYLMRKAGADIDYWTNHRSDGFGMSVPTVKKMLEKYPDTKLVVSTDNGIVAFDAVDYLKEQGVDVIITDHHQADESGKVPNADAIINPNQPKCGYPFKGLSGAGVIWKLMMLVYEKLGRNPNEVYEVIDIVSLSTVADVVPIISENRVIVKEGLAKINKRQTPVWNLMREVFADFYNDLLVVDSETFGFTYGPAINAMSRMEGSIEVPIDAFLDYMLGDATEEETKEKFELMLTTNDSRKDESKDFTNAAMGYVINNEKYDLPAIVVAHPEFNEGIVGIIAGRLKDKFNRPTIVFTEDSANKDVYKGSGRSIEGFPLKDILDEINNINPDVFIKYGGHDMAAGISLKKDQLETFEQLFVMQAYSKLTEEDYTKKIRVDYALDAKDVSIEHLDIIKSLEPFGKDFEKPLIGIRNFNVTNYEVIGQTKEHIVFYSGDLKVVSWFGKKQWDSLGQPKNLYLVGQLDADSYSGKVEINVDPHNIMSFN